MQFDRVIITGASSGFGMAYARRLGAECSQLVLVARRLELLKELTRELQAAYPQLQVETCCCDLASASERTHLIQMLSHPYAGRTLLINNAGLGDYGAFSESLPERNAQMMMVNVVALTELTRALLPCMEQRGGAVVNVSSLASDLFIPDFAVYAATKAYVSSFSEALRLECREKNIPVLAVCPGPVSTGFGEVARREGFTGDILPSRGFLDCPISTVIEGTLDALRRNEARFYPSFKVRMLALFVRNAPLWLLRLILSVRPRRVQAQLPSPQA